MGVISGISVILPAGSSVGSAVSAGISVGLGTAVGSSVGIGEGTGISVGETASVTLSGSGSETFSSFFPRIYILTFRCEYLAVMNPHASVHGSHDTVPQRQNFFHGRQHVLPHSDKSYQ